MCNFLKHKGQGRSSNDSYNYVVSSCFGNQPKNGSMEHVCKQNNIVVPIFVLASSFFYESFEGCCQASYYDGTCCGATDENDTVELIFQVLKIFSYSSTKASLLRKECSTNINLACNIICNKGRTVAFTFLSIVTIQYLKHF